MFVYEAAVSYLEQMLVNHFQTAAVLSCPGWNIPMSQAAHVLGSSLLTSCSVLYRIECSNEPGCLMFMYEAAVSYLEKLLVNHFQTEAVLFCTG
jgi:hypothetical protein